MGKLERSHDGKPPIFSVISDEGIMIVNLNQPEKRNAISVEMMRLFERAMDEADMDDGVLVVVLRGVGDTFCSGGDLSQGIAASAGPAGARASLRAYLKAVRAIRRCAKPVVCMVDGYAVGGGFSLAVACDVLCASERALFVPAFCQIGIAPEMGIAKHLSECVGPQRTKELLFLGGKISAAELFSMGVVNHVWPDSDVERETMSLARKIASMPSHSIQTAKSMVNALYDGPLASVLDAEASASPLCGAISSYQAEDRSA